MSFIVSSFLVMLGTKIKWIFLKVNSFLNWYFTYEFLFFRFIFPPSVILLKKTGCYKKRIISHLVGGSDPL